MPLGVAARAAAVALALAVAAPAAHASQASVVGGTLHLNAGAGEANVVQMDNNFLSGQTVFVEDQAGITPGQGCVASSATEVECTSAYSSVHVELGDGADRFNTGFVNGVVTVNGGPGDDRIMGLYESGVVDGGDGNDMIDGGTGNDRLSGGPGSDTIEGKGGSDTVDGGTGTDILVGDSSRSSSEGNDTILARDGERDQISCGGGADQVTADAIDIADTSQCEFIDVPQEEQEEPEQPEERDQAGVPAKCRGLEAGQQRTCVKRHRAIKRCKAIKGRSKKAKRKRAKCMRKATQIGRAGR